MWVCSSMSCSRVSPEKRSDPTHHKGAFVSSAQENEERRYSDCGSVVDAILQGTRERVEGIGELGRVTFHFQGQTRFYPQSISLPFYFYRPGGAG